MTSHVGDKTLHLPQGQYNEHNVIQNIQNITTSPPPDNRLVKVLRERMCAGAAFDSAERGDPPRCHKDTRRAILSSTSSWVDDITALFFYLWITGWAGVGKSAILQTLAEEFATKSRLAASFFFFQASRNRNTIHGFIATIACQLMESVPGAREIILRKISNNATIFVDKSFEGQWQILVVDTLRKLPPPAPMLIVIDGVDEILSHGEQETLLRAVLWSVVQLGPGYKLLVAARPEGQIEAIFRQTIFRLLGLTNVNRVDLGNTPDAKADIGLFLRLSLEETRIRKRLSLSVPTRQSWPEQRTIECLVDKASGQFIYAKTIVCFVEHLDDDPDAALEMIMNRDPHLKSFKELDYLYLLLMERIKRLTKKQNHDLLHHLLVCIYMHLVKEFEGQIRLLCPRAPNVGLPNILLGKLDPVVDENGEYRHKSFIEFLTKPSAPHPFSINSWHISEVISQCLSPILASRRDATLLFRFLECSSPTPGIILRLHDMPQGTLASWNRMPGCRSDGSLWDDTYLRCWSLGWLSINYHSSSNNRVELNVDPRPPLHSWWNPLFVFIGLPYYTCLAIIQTSRYLYKFRIHDLEHIDKL
ncbi:hypothetical protein BDN72DRAFT_957423 [Pluteus cervinus]|uniref:Uncharacterized protein n=1 Tax=Pluteus cervinus TaxID=181527 RepID=A0ACD3B3P2_9AGAR|nr:hypothetical protein BDN72DRAFT_957423 [Pluteus cervinus]